MVRQQIINSQKGNLRNGESFLLVEIIIVLQLILGRDNVARKYLSLTTF